MKYRVIEIPGKGKQVIKHKFDAEQKSTPADTLKTSDGTKYAQMIDGSRHRIDPKSWNGKSERRKVLAFRRENARKTFLEEVRFT